MRMTGCPRGHFVWLRETRVPGHGGQADAFPHDLSRLLSASGTLPQAKSGRCFRGREGDLIRDQFRLELDVDGDRILLALLSADRRLYARDRQVLFKRFDQRRFIRKNECHGN
jgi:hypothetical protein